MERFVVEQNIARYRGLLAGDLDPEERQTTKRLLKGERQAGPAAGDYILD